MKPILLYFISVISIICASCEAPASNEELGEMKAPDNWFFEQRAYPYDTLPIQAYTIALEQAQEQVSSELEQRGETSWRLVGPTNIGGRITDIVLHPNNPNIIFAGTASGGIFKTTDKGQTWKSVFDKQKRLSIGSLAIAASNTKVLYAGTGEANGSASSGAFFGDGVYKSEDAGRSWRNIGLKKSYHIGRVVVNPSDENHVLVAAAGLLYGKNEERGLYQTKDGGKNWEKILFLSDSTSCIDVAIHPTQPNIIYAATWERIRYADRRNYAGTTSRIYRSKDGGVTWEHLKNGLPPSTQNTGRIGIALSNSNPNILYASFTQNPTTNEFDGLYKSTDGGNTWKETNRTLLNGMYSTFGWYFGQVRIDPNDANTAYTLGVNLFQTQDAGARWTRISNNIHVDQHDLEVHPKNSNFIVAGNDGGIYLSEDKGRTWRHSKNLPITQFYNCEVAQAAPTRFYGGTQDNGTIMTQSGATNDWYEILGGDGFHVIVDPEISDFIYAEYQWGNLFRSLDGGRTFQWSLNGVATDDRKNWNTPVKLDPNNTSILYYGTQRLYRSTNRAATWQVISGDLTKGVNVNSTVGYGTISTIAVSPANSNVIYVGTDDGNLQVTLDGGINWKIISDSLPNRYVTSIATHPTDQLKAYVTFSGFRDNDYFAHVWKTENAGHSWSPLNSGLPDIPVNKILIDTKDFQTLYLATDLGVWYSRNEGAQWKPLGNELPAVVVSDLVIHKTKRTLLAATYGRSIYEYYLDEMPPSYPDVEANAPNFSATQLLSQNTIQIELPVEIPSTIGFEVFDLKGNKVAQYPAKWYDIGTHTIEIPCQAMTSSVLVVNMSAKTFSTSKRLLFLKD